MFQKLFRDQGCYSIICVSYKVFLLFYIFNIDLPPQLYLDVVFPTTSNHISCGANIRHKRWLTPSKSKKGLVPEIDLAAATLLPAMTTSSGQIKGLVGVGSGVAAREALCTKAEAHAGRWTRCVNARRRDPWYCFPAYRSDSHSLRGKPWPDMEAGERRKVAYTGNFCTFYLYVFKNVC